MTRYRHSDSSTFSHCHRVVNGMTSAHFTRWSCLFASSKVLEYGSLFEWFCIERKQPLEKLLKFEQLIKADEISRFQSIRCPWTQVIRAELGNLRKSFKITSHSIQKVPSVKILRLARFRAKCINMPIDLFEDGFKRGKQENVIGIAPRDNKFSIRSLFESQLTEWFKFILIMNIYSDPACDYSCLLTVWLMLIPLLSFRQSIIRAPLQFSLRKASRLHWLPERTRSKPGKNSPVRRKPSSRSHEQSNQLDQRVRRSRNRRDRKRVTWEQATTRTREDRVRMHQMLESCCKQYVGPQRVAPAGSTCSRASARTMSRSQ